MVYLFKTEGRFLIQDTVASAGLKAVITTGAVNSRIALITIAGMDSLPSDHVECLRKT